MSLTEIYRQFIEDIYATTWLEFTAVICGIASVIFSRREHILVYPIGMINTGIYIYIYLTVGLYADASVNLYYTIMSIIGWVLWTRKKEGTTVLQVTASTRKDWQNSLFFFAGCWLTLFLVLKSWTPSTVPIFDSFTAAAAFTGMWLMAKKKLESWIWWIITNIASIPLNFYKHLVFTSFQYLVFLILAVMGYITWRNKIRAAKSIR
jgi:nicotinamide mononucleotide transporter